MKMREGAAVCRGINFQRKQELTHSHLPKLASTHWPTAGVVPAERHQRALNL